MANDNVHVRWEVWIGEWSALISDYPELRWRFNACFDARKAAEAEGEWYRKHGYTLIDIRCRTSRYQDRRHVTTR